MSDNSFNVKKAATASMNSSQNQNDSCVTMLDVLEQEKELEEEYVAVLGGSDEKCCTYSKGYVKRQALYSCLTCIPESKTDIKKRAGICLACSYSCHEGHEMVELYTKRNFRCDCGTSKMLAVKCKLDSIKLECNNENLYNQNFAGLYCNCHRPYPDTDDPIDDEMIQCIMCEDWYHCRHLGAPVPNMNMFSEMICEECMEKNDFLLYYNGLSVTAGAKNDKDKADVEVDVDVDEGSKLNDSSIIEEKPEEKNDEGGKVDEILKDEINQCIMDIIEINKTKSEGGENEPPQKKLKLEESASKSGDIPKVAYCKKPKKAALKTPGATFWPLDWRKNICSCTECMIELNKYKAEYLIDLEDTVLSYEEKGLAKVRESEYDSGMKALSKMDRVKQIDVIMGYNKMKEKLMEFLNAFVTNQQVVTEDDINRFFRMLKEKNENGGKPLPQ